MHYFQFNIGEYASHTRHLSPLEDIAYRRLLDLAYTTEQPIIKDLRQLTRLINLREYEVEVGDVLKEFFYEVDDGWLNNRVIKEIEKTGAKSLSAKNSAAKRWDNERKAKAMREESERIANASNNHANASNQHKSHQNSAPDNSENSHEKCEMYANASEINANASKNDATNNPLPITHNQTHTEVGNIPQDQTENQSTLAGQVCVSLKKIGVTGLNPSNPNFTALLEAGATLQEFIGAADNASVKKFAYVIAVVKGQREEAAKLNLHKGAMPVSEKQTQSKGVASSIFGGAMPPQLQEVEVYDVKAIA